MSQPDESAAPRKDVETSREATISAKPSQPQGVSFVPRILAAAAFTIILIGGILYWSSVRNIESTDDAFIDGRAVVISPQVAGSVASLDVTDNQFVHKGDPLIHIADSPYIHERDQAQGALDTAEAQLAGQRLGAEIARKNFPAQLAQARAQLETAQAALARAEADYRRQRSLPKRATTQQEIDAATAALREAQAQTLVAQAQVTQAEPAPQRVAEAETLVGQLGGQVEAAKARLEQAKLNLAWAVVKAPLDGWVTKRNVEAGAYVAVGQQIMAIVSPEVWVTANFKEAQLEHMRPGQKVDIEVDAFPQLSLKGHVDGVQLGTGAKFTAFPPENATGNFVKIVQRVPVKIVIDSGLDPNLPLPLGLSVTPRVKVQ